VLQCVAVEVRAEVHTLCNGGPDMACLAVGELAVVGHALRRCEETLLCVNIVSETNGCVASIATAQKSPQRM
jgi:hypothetical protein